MPVYSDSEQLYSSLKLLFGRIQNQDATNQAVAQARVIIRLRCSLPAAEVVINGRKIPLQVVYGLTALRPDLDVDLSADALHDILLAKLPLRSAINSGQMKVRGQIWKTSSLEVVLHYGQTLYPQVLKDLGLNGYALKPG